MTDGLNKKSKSGDSDNMDEFVDLIEKERKKVEAHKDCQLRELLRYVTGESPEVTIETDESNGDVRLIVSRKELGIPFDMLLKYRKEVFSEFFVNFIAEFLIRENINKLAQIMTNMNGRRYSATVNKYDHKRCGMEVKKDKFIFMFHMSLIQRILMEGFKKQVRGSV